MEDVRGLRGMNDLKRIARDVGFEQWHRVQGRVSVADNFPQPHRRGIYVLSFANGEAYVGQAVDVTRRYAQHRKVHRDIEAIAFKPMRQGDLNQEERAVVRKFEVAGIPLRNVMLVSFPTGPSDFDLIMSAEDQERWLADVSYVDSDGPRTDDSELRRRFAKRYERLLRRPDAQEAIRVLKEYVQRGIPAFPRSEMAFWICSCLPHSSDSTVQVYSRISIYQQEVFVAYRCEEQLHFTWHLARSPLERSPGLSRQFSYSLPSVLRRAVGRLGHWIGRTFPSVEVFQHAYEPGGEDQIALEAHGVDAARRLLNDPAVLRSMRSFNLGLIRKGPCMFSRYHCFALADTFYEQDGKT